MCFFSDVHDPIVTIQQSYSTVISRKMNPTAALDKVKAFLNNTPTNSELDIGIYGEKCYFISVQHGLQWNELPKSLAKPILLRISLEKLQTSFMKNVRCFKCS